MKRSTSLSRWTGTSVVVALAAACVRPGVVLAQTTLPGGSLTLRDAIQRGLQHNVTVVGLANMVDQARGQQKIARSALLPNISGDVGDNEQQVNLSALGVRLDVPGFAVPDVVGPFNVLDVRARFTQTVVNRTVLNNYRAAQETVRANELSVEHSHDVIAVAIATAYLEALAVRARLAATRVQLETATTIYRRAVQQRAAGLATPVDVNRAQVQTLVEQQRVVALQAEFAKRKIDLARLIGLSPTDQYELSDDIAYSAMGSLTVDAALKEAAEHRSDLKAAEAQVRAAERGAAAAQAARLPSVLVSADVGASRASDRPMHPTYALAGVVRVPIWEGGRTAGAIEQTGAALRQRRAELEDLKAQVEADVRKAYVDLEAAASQIDVARANRQLTQETLGLSRQRFDAGVNDNVSVVQAQESLALAEFGYIDAVFAHNLAKLGLARTIGRASEDLAQYLQLP